MLKIKDNVDLERLFDYGFKIRNADYYLVKKVYLENGNDDKNFYEINPKSREIRLTRLDGELDNTLYELIKADLVDEVEIIEEDKGISKDIKWYLIDFQEEEKTKIAQVNMNFKLLREKLVEIIDKINEMEDK